MASEAAELEETGLTIADAAAATGVSAHTLRYYERAGLIDGVDRAASGHRRYGEADLAWVETLRMSGGRPGCRSAASAATRTWCGRARSSRRRRPRR